MATFLRTACVTDQPIPVIDPSLQFDWRALYQAAIFEDDKSKIAARVTAAENALRATAILLAESHESSKELRDMERAMYFLRLLENQSWD